MKKLHVYGAGTSRILINVLVYAKIVQFQEMGNESERYRDAANGLSGNSEITQTMLMAYFGRNWQWYSSPKYDVFSWEIVGFSRQVLG